MTAVFTAAEVTSEQRGQAHQNTDADVVIVGYGPVGQLLALKLARAGRRVAVVEKWQGSYPRPRAVHLDDEVGRILQSVGIRPDESPVLDPYDDWYACRNDAGETILLIDWTGVGPSWWHTSNFFHQPDLEAELHRLVEAEPLITLHSGWTVTTVDQSPDGVSVTAEPTQTTSNDVARVLTVNASFAVGCDGANSVVRSSIETEMEDLGFRFDWLIVDVIPSEPLVFTPPVQQLCTPAGPTTLVPGGPGRRRWEFMRMPGETVESLNTPESAWSKLKPWNLNPQNAVLERHTVYTFQAKWARAWRNGRVLIAGDAAHLMPPFAGQGMCSGLRDAMNLAWKLDGILSGRLPDSLLDTYGPERIQHVRRWVETSVEIGRTICVTDWEQAAARDAAMKAAIEDPSLAPPPPPPATLGPGLLRPLDPAAGHLAIQSMTRTGNGNAVLFDDQFGSGWFVLTDDPQIRQALSETTTRWLEDSSIRVLTFGASEDFDDVRGAYADWLKALDKHVVIIRPDFYVYGACDRDELEQTLSELHARLTPLEAPTARQPS